MCRECINDDPEPLRCAAQPSELQNAPDFELTNELKGLQVRMASLYIHQMKRGGIIDSSAEDSAVIAIQSEDPNEGVSTIKILASELHGLTYIIFNCSRRENRKTQLK